MKGVFEDGVELVIKEQLCPKCSSTINHRRIPSKKGVVKTKYSCTKCDYEEIDTFTLGDEETKIDPLYETDKARFCLAGEELKEALSSFENMERVKRLTDGWKHEAEHKDAYDAVAQLKKLTIPQVKQHITKALETSDYLNLTFEKPSIERYVSLVFSVEELETDNPRMSTSKLQKLVKKALEGTNWRLMTGGVDYRLGLLSGRIRAYETEEDMFHLVNKKKSYNSEIIEQIGLKCYSVYT